MPDFAVASADGTQRVAELARDGRPLLVDLTESGAVSAAVTTSQTSSPSPPDGLSVSCRHGRAGASRWLCGLGVVTGARPDPDELRELRSVLTHWFGI